MKLLFILAVCILAFLGCSKTNDSAVVEEHVETGEAAVPVPENPQIKSDLDTINAEIAAKNYDAALQKIAVLENLPKSEQQEQEYRQRVSQAADALYSQGQSDPQAMERYLQLGRIRKGR